MCAASLLVLFFYSSSCHSNMTAGSAPAIRGDGMGEVKGVSTGVLKRGLYRSVGGRQPCGVCGWVLDRLVICWEPYRGEGERVLGVM
jgi:hypothetical protein